MKIKNIFINLRRHLCHETKHGQNESSQRIKKSNFIGTRSANQSYNISNQI